MYALLASSGRPGGAVITRLDADLAVVATLEVDAADLPAVVARIEAGDDGGTGTNSEAGDDGGTGTHVRAGEIAEGDERTDDASTADVAGTDAAVAPPAASQPRWVWASARAWYPALLAAGVRLERCTDLRLCHAILRHSAATAASALATSPEGPWDLPLLPDAGDDDAEGLFRLDPGEGIEGLGTEALLAELRLQLDAVRSAESPERLRLLLAAESAGALIAAEIKHHGLPWDTGVHDRQLTALLGPRPRHGGRPAKLEALAEEIRTLLGDPRLNPDSPAEVLRALKRAGLEAATTRQWELERLDHPAIPPLLEYKKLARLLSANGWSWMDTWIAGGRFRPDYLPGGVVTGRWAAIGGGALQLPKQVRAAVVADPGWKLVVADASQLEPRVLAAMARDQAMAKASRGADLYQALVDEKIVDTRAHAKVAMLGALYGATSGESGALMPRLMRAYPLATGLVERAAESGERGLVVSTWLGRSSPPPSEKWQETQRLASEPSATPSDERRARSQARDWGRFTRNFVVQGTAAEWALCWMAGLRTKLNAMARPGAAAPHLVFFMHDEVIVHAPGELADDVVRAIRESADTAGRLLFGTFPVEFALSVATVDNYAQAK